MDKCFCHLNGYEVKDATARNNIETINSNIETINNDIETINTDIDNNDLTEFVVLGDSWSDLNVTDSIWSTKAAQILGLNLTNYAKSGAGFIEPTSNLIQTQLNNFTNSDINKSKVKYIVLMGGINDFRRSVTEAQIRAEIISIYTALKNLCPQAKILYVSNCQYPYTYTQSVYWRTLHNNLSALGFLTYSLDGTLGNLLYNNTNYFHLTQTGYKFMARNIMCALTGGELIKFEDTRLFEDDNAKYFYTCEKITNNISMIHIQFMPKVAQTSYEYTLADSVPGLSYGNDVYLYGSVGAMNVNMTCDVSSNKILINSLDTQLQVNRIYMLDMFVRH